MSSSAPTTPGARRIPGFATRLLLAQALVLFAGALTIWLVASAAGPSIFHAHLVEAGVAHSETETAHVEEAFASALLLSVAVALVAAVAAALAVSWYFSRRIQRSLGHVADAAADIASGHYESRVDDPGLGREFTALAATYNTLADRLEATETTRRRMLADLAHEMRTPLATIDAHLEAVEDGVRDLDTTTLDVLTSSTRRLRRLAEDMTAVSRAEEGNLRLELQPFQAADLAVAAADAARNGYTEKGVTLTTDLPPAGKVAVDPDRIGQVLGNLLDNALRHTPASGTVTLSCRRNDRWVEYTVTDNGEGIAAEHLPHLFDRFYRVDTARDRNRGGSGIGLAIAKSLVQAHGGGIHATSPGPDRGATFTVRLPAS
jgi:two-component system sensor histidine kinase BaeS